MANEDASKLFVAGLPDSITEDVLRRLFEATGGTVVNVSLPKDRATGRPRGFGFVTLSSPQEASSARDALDGSMQAGRPISVRPFSSEPPRRDARGPDAGAPGGGGGYGERGGYGDRERGPGGGGGGGGGYGGGSSSEDRTLYVGNLPYDVSQQELETLFSENGAGPVARIHLPVGPDGRPRGFGFVTLHTAEAANSAIVALRSVEVRGRRLMVNIANPRGASPGGGGAGPRTSQAPMSRGPRPMRDEGGFESRPAPDRFEGEPGASTTEDGGDPDASGEGRRPRSATSSMGPGAAKKKEKKKGKGRSEREEERRRGGGGSWQKWADWDDD